MTRPKIFVIVSLAVGVLLLHSRSPISKPHRFDRVQSEVSNRQMPRSDSAPTSQDRGWSLGLTRSRSSKPSNQQGQSSGGFSVVAVNLVKPDGTVISRAMNPNAQDEIGVPRFLRIPQ